MHALTWRMTVRLPHSEHASLSLQWTHPKSTGQNNSCIHASQELISMHPYLLAYLLACKIKLFVCFAQASEDGEIAGIADGRRVIIWPVSKGWKKPLKLYHTKNLMVRPSSSSNDYFSD